MLLQIITFPGLSVNDKKDYLLLESRINHRLIKG